jgi:sugar phosphate isomerase/epimerase
LKENLIVANRISLQFYTLRERAAQDFVGTLEAAKAAGYDAIEIAGYGGMDARQLRTELDRIGLVASGAHTSIERFEDDLPNVIAELQILGVRHAICPWLGPQRRPDAEGYKKLASDLNAIGATCAKADISFAYHHHDFELQRFGDTTGLHILLHESDPAYVKAEIDVYWAAYAGFDPIGLLQEFAGRVPLIHLKDMTAAPERTFAEVGYGTMNIPAILATADAIGAEWIIVEQDKSTRDALESVRMSREYLRSLGR